MVITESKYDEAIEKMGKIQQDTFWPELDEIDQMEKDPDKWILFAIYLYEHGEKPKTKDEEYRKKTLLEFINNHLEIVDDPEE